MGERHTERSAAASPPECSQYPDQSQDTGIPSESPMYIVRPQVLDSHLLPLRIHIIRELECEQGKTQMQILLYGVWTSQVVPQCLPWKVHSFIHPFNIEYLLQAKESQI